MKTKMLDGTGFRHYRYTQINNDRHGNPRVYFQRKKSDPKIRMQSTPGTPEFENEYRKLFDGSASFDAPPIPRAIAGAGSLPWLCQQYYKSAAFKTLGDTTRKVRRNILDGLCETWIGEHPYKFIEPRHIAKIRDDKSDTPEAANSIIKALRQLFNWACAPEYAHATKNPAKEVKYLASNNPDGFKAWTEDNLLRFETRHPIGTPPRLALDLMLYTGVRRSDVVRLGPQMEQNGKLVFTEMKGRKTTVKRHAITILPALRASIDATPTGHLVYLPTKYGKPRSVKAFGNWFKRQCRLAGLEDCSAHGIRKLGAMRAVQNGATEHQLMALFGWTDSKTAALYVKKANRETLENDAVSLLATDRTENDFPSPFGDVAFSGGKTAKKANDINGGNR